MKVEPDRFAEFAKRADRHVSHASEGRLPSAPDIQVSLEYLEEVPTAARRSGLLPVARSFEDARLEAVPVIALSKEDLAWFEFEPDASALLALVDGRTSLADILASVAVDPERALQILGDLEQQRVIALG